MMKDRALRRHQDFKAKRKSQQTYNSCISDLPRAKIHELENNVGKLRKICVAVRPDKTLKKAGKKPLREMKHDITMKEQLRMIG